MADTESVRTSFFGGYGLGSFLAIVIGVVLFLIFTRMPSLVQIESRIAASWGTAANV